MRKLIKHLVKNNFAEIQDKSLFNCHIRGLHSIMLLEAPGKTIRLYVSMPNSDMHLNKMPLESMSLSFHPHHCNLTLHCVKGLFTNWIVEEKHGSLHSGFPISKYIYKSQITGGNMGFERVGNAVIETKSHGTVYEGQSVHMNANEIHSVHCPANKVCAWLVYEGAEDQDYIPYSYSAKDLTEINSEGLYTKPTWDEILELLKLVGLMK